MSALSLKAVEGGCEEASIHSHDVYIPCNGPAERMIYLERDDTTLRMCAMCADHNLRNRNAQDRGPYTGPKKPVGTNNPPSPVDAFRDKLAMRALKVSQLPELTVETAPKWKDEMGLLKSLKSDIEATHKSEKAPFLEGGRKVDAAYKPLAEEADDRAKAINTKLEAHAKAEKKKADDRAREAAEALRRAEEEAAAKAAQPAPEDDLMAFLEEPGPDVQAIAVDAKVAEMQALAAKRVGSEAGGFKASTLRTVKKLRVDDFKLLVAHYWNHPDMKALAERLANADLRHAKGAELTLPGVTIYDDEVLR